MAIINFNTLLPVFGVDSVAVFNQEFKQVFRDARALKAVVKETSKVMEHPVESGIIITDHRIILPIEIDLALILSSGDYQSVYEEIRGYYLNATILTVQTRSGVYNNMLIASMPHEEDPTMYEALAVALTMKQVLFAVAKFGVVPKQAKNSTNVTRGKLQPAKPVTPSTARQIGKAISDFSGAVTKKIKGFFG